MSFLNLSKSQLSRDEMRTVIAGIGGVSFLDAGGGPSCHAYCDRGESCPTGCVCQTNHGADRCYEP